MPTFLRPAPLLAIAMLAAACSAAGAPSTAPSAAPSASPSGAPPATPGASPSPSSGAFGAVEHATGPTDVLLRFDQGGGFVTPAFLATQAPIFTLYGDGTVVFRNPAAELPPAVGNVQPFSPFRTAKLSEDQIQALLEFALGEGGLGVARPNYTNEMVADASTATFTVNAGGLQKTVAVYALGIDSGNAARGLPKLAERLGNLDANGAFTTEVYSPERYRGILTEGFAGDPGAKPWPWKDLKPADFKLPADPNAFQLATAPLTVAQVEALGVKPYQGGVQNVTLVGPGDGKLYSFALRLLLRREVVGIARSCLRRNGRSDRNDSAMNAS